MDKRLQAMANVDRTIHEPSRLMIVAILYCVESADFLYLLRETRMTKGNLSSHLAKLEESGYVEIEKTYRGKVPLTICRLSKSGQTAFRQYRGNLKRAMDSMPK